MQRCYQQLFNSCANFSAKLFYYLWAQSHKPQYFYFDATSYSLTMYAQLTNVCNKFNTLMITKAVLNTYAEHCRNFINLQLRKPHN